MQSLSQLHEISGYRFMPRRAFVQSFLQKNPTNLRGETKHPALFRPLFRRFGRLHENDN